MMFFSNVVTLQWGSGGVSRTGLLARTSRGFALVLLVGAVSMGAFAQTAPEVARTAKVVPVDGNAAGDAPDDPGPLAKGLSTELKPEAIDAAIKKVADWQVAYAEPHFNKQWTFAALYDGLLAASKTTGDLKYRDAVLHLAERSDWTLLDARFPHADDQALGQAYMDLYREDSQPVRMADTKAIMDRLIVREDDPNKLLWWWCDALFMSPPVLSRMYAITKDRKYLDYMDHEWWLTSGSLYSQEEHLYFRDSRYFMQKQANGKPIFWSRGNGWVMGALVNVLRIMPVDYPSRPKYVAQFREMAGELAAIQSPDGLWRSGLLDPESYDLPEVSGSAFFTFAIAYGINEKILDRKTYLPVVEKSWKGMLGHIYADGRLGSIQPIDGQPGKFKLSASYVYGVGGFLMAGSEMHRLAASKH
ncbi:glycoside hydrolase family 88/105 protein [Tunturiibacter gelidoferens]|uniref:Rhamnogalacturonyl hydrolase YesR n=1 Tax=Tunturiibacter gelidiferens TaxID=3069689 RepID=A0ACC5NU28_9BACT|nr:glycoside hydrolase family 88 protein [Edaphobacter lichenicola]MBB5338055.1 rhamnogalacturonyl hydrolase YesR [Edaphobacter lichenicola]